MSTLSTWIGKIYNAQSSGLYNLGNKCASTATSYSLQVKCMNMHIQISYAGMRINVPFQQNVTFSEHIFFVKD